MPTIKVNTSRLSGYESDMQNVLSKVNSIIGQFDSVSRNLDWDVRVESNINSRLAGISRELSAEARGISGLKNYLGTAVRQYNTVESTNKKNTLKDEVSGYNSGTCVNDKSSKANKTGGTSTQFGGTATWIIGKDGKSIKNTGYLNYNGFYLGPVVSAGGTNTASTNSTSTKSGCKPDWTKGLFKVVGKVGNVGSIAGSIYTLSSGIASGKDSKVSKAIISVSKDCISRFGTLAKDAYSGTSVKETLFGNWTMGDAVTSLFKTAEQATSPTEGVIFKTTLAKEFKGYSFKNATNVGSKIKVATKWAGTGLSAVTNFISNKEEQKKNPGMSNARVVLETVVETAVDVGVGALATAFVTALLGTVVPAVAVGAIAVGVVWAANTIVEADSACCWGEENKKNLTELVSDAIIDGSTYVGKKVGSAVKGRFNEVTKWGESLFGG